MKRYPPSPSDVIAALRAHDAKAHAAVVAGRRTSDAVIARRTCMAASRAFGWSFCRIGRAFNRDHTTVLQACNRYQDLQKHKVPGAEEEADLFRSMIAGANAVAEKRRAMA